MKRNSNWCVVFLGVIILTLMIPVNIWAQDVTEIQMETDQKASKKKLEAPTELKWNESNPGVLEFNMKADGMVADANGFCWFKCELFKDDILVSEIKGYVRAGDSQGICNAKREIVEHGTGNYIAKICACSNKDSYEDSECAVSDEFTYTLPEQKLYAPQNINIVLESTNNVSLYWDGIEVDNVAQYCIETCVNGEVRWTEWIDNHSTGDRRSYAMMSEYGRFGSGVYTFKVWALPADITVHQVSEAGISPEYNYITDDILNDATGIPDKALYKLLLDACGNASGVLTKTEVQKITELEYKTYVTDDKKIESLEGIQYCENLKNLSLISAGVTDITPLEGMQIERLNLYMNGVTDLSPLKGMQLKFLNIASNRVSDISVLEGMPLEELNLGYYWGNQKREDYRVLKGMPLKVLSIYDYPYEDLELLRGMELESLTINKSTISNIDALEGMPLTRLEINNTLLSDVSVLSGMQFELLDLSDNKIKDVSSLKDVTIIGAFGVGYLNLTNNNISDLSPLKDSLLAKSLETVVNANPEFVWNQAIKIGNGNSIKKSNAEENLPYALFSANALKKYSESSWETYSTTWSETQEFLNDNEELVVFPEENVPVISIENSFRSLKDKILTEAEKALVESGISVSISFEIKDITGTININDKKVMEQAIEDFDCSHGQFIDISLNKKVDNVETPVTETTGKIMIEITIPEELRNKNTLYKRKFFVIRVHGDEVTILENLDARNDKITFETDKFSSYAIVYKDEEASALNTFVKRLYTLVLEREPEISGWKQWVDALLSGESSGVDTGYGFVFSPECIKRNLSNEDFVEMLYLTFMNRPSDEAGRNAWVSQLEIGVEREKVFEGFVYSDEFRGICEEYGIEVGNTESVDAFAEALGHYCNQNADITAFVARCYTKAMGRPYDPAGLEDWCRVIITQDDTPTNVAKCFIFSDEFVDKGLSDEEYVKVLYRTFMGREADEEGLAGWIGVLQAGEEDREKVLDGFANSLEFAEILEGFGLN